MRLARDFFADTRRAVKRLRSIQLLIQFDGEDWKPTDPRTSNPTSDPTASRGIYYAEILPAKLAQLHAEERELTDMIGEALALIERVRSNLGDKYADPLDWRYIDLRTWEYIYTTYNIPKSTAYERMSIALDWLDSEEELHDD